MSNRSSALDESAFALFAYAASEIEWSRLLLEEMNMRMRIQRMRRGEESKNTIAKTETDTQLLLHNRNSKEDRVEGGHQPYYNVSSWGHADCNKSIPMSNGDTEGE